MKVCLFKEEVQRTSLHFSREARKNKFTETGCTLSHNIHFSVSIERTGCCISNDGDGGGALSADAVTLSGRTDAELVGSGASCLGDCFLAIDVIIVYEVLLCNFESLPRGVDVQPKILSTETRRRMGGCGDDGRSNELLPSASFAIGSGGSVYFAESWSIRPHPSLSSD